jgi:hypothetical protein
MPLYRGSMHSEASLTSGVPKQLHGLVTHNLTRVLRIFAALDKDHNGTLNLEEFEQVLLLLGRSDLDPLRVFNAIDQDKDGTIGVHELLALSMVCTDDDVPKAPGKRPLLQRACLLLHDRALGALWQKPARPVQALDLEPGWRSEQEKAAGGRQRFRYEPREVASLDRECDEVEVALKEAAVGAVAELAAVLREVRHADLRLQIAKMSVPSKASWWSMHHDEEERLYVLGRCLAAASADLEVAAHSLARYGPPEAAPRLHGRLSAPYESWMERYATKPMGRHFGDRLGVSMGILVTLAILSRHLPMAVKFESVSTCEYMHFACTAPALAGLFTCVLAADNSTEVIFPETAAFRLLPNSSTVLDEYNYVQRSFSKQIDERDLWSQKCEPRPVDFALQRAIQAIPNALVIVVGLYAVAHARVHKVCLDHATRPFPYAH